MITIYGIKNCSTVQKAVKYLELNNIEYTFWDYKKVGIDKEHLVKWCEVLTWQKILNRSGMMWRKADEKSKLKVVDQKSAIEFMLSTPTSIKRPIIEIENGLILGFDEKNYHSIFGIK
jgi:arsenate reductase (glutaredoxin)